MATKLDPTRRVRTLARRLGVLRPRDLDPLGIPREYLSRLVQGGVLLRTGRGLYSLADADTTENHDLARVAKRAPHGVICLLSALRFHDLTTQLPFEVWIAIGVKARAPKVTSPQLRVVRFSGQALVAGVEEHSIEGVPVRIYGVAKTVADCFKFRRKIGLEVALEALRDCWKQRRATMDDLWRYAKVCRVANVMRPYLESLV